MGMNDDNTVSFFSSHSLSAKAGFLAVHARKLQALAKRSGGDKSVGSKTATGSASSKTLSSARRIIGTSLDRPSERESESGASTFLGADQRHWEPTTSYLSALENREPASPGVGREPPTEALLAQSRDLVGQGKLGEATALCERAVKVMTRTEEGEKRPETMQAIAMLAELSRRRGRLEEAALHAAWLLRLKKQNMPEEDLSTADTFFLLGQIYKQQVSLFLLSFQTATLFHST
jgi:hypothetical protein